MGKHEIISAPFLAYSQLPQSQLLPLVPEILTRG